jgi:predicted RNA methylase
MESTQITGLKRNTIDKYYTKNEIVELCLNNVKTHIPIDKETDLIIEPSAGNGSFITGIKQLSSHFIFCDIEPEHNEIIKQDYLMLDHNNFKGKFSNIHIIGNPPFGRQSSFAIQFIKKSCDFCNSLSFILPKSFKKDSLKKHFPSSFHLIFESDLPDKSFLVDGVEHNVPCVFQIWQKKMFDRVVTEKIKPKYFEFVQKTDNPDISFRRVGVYAGKIDKNIDKSVQSHYFIKFTNNKTIDENITELTKIKYDFNNTVGPKSISKQELIKEFIKVL